MRSSHVANSGSLGKCAYVCSLDTDAPKEPFCTSVDDTQSSEDAVNVNLASELHISVWFSESTLVMGSSLVLLRCSSCRIRCTHLCSGLVQLPWGCLSSARLQDSAAMMGDKRLAESWHPSLRSGRVSEGSPHGYGGIEQACF